MFYVSQELIIEINIWKNLYAFQCRRPISGLPNVETPNLGVSTRHMKKLSATGVIIN